MTAVNRCIGLILMLFLSIFLWNFFLKEVEIDSNLRIGVGSGISRIIVEDTIRDLKDLKISVDFTEFGDC